MVYALCYFRLVFIFYLLTNLSFQSSFYGIISIIMVHGDTKGGSVKFFPPLVTLSLTHILVIVGPFLPMPRASKL